MDRVWITNGSTSVPPVVNTLIAACEDGTVPDKIHVLSNPAITDVTKAATTLMETTVAAYGGTEPIITIESINEETDFTAITDYLETALDGAQAANAEVSIDITPGRRFWSIISFQAGVTYDVSHLYYSHVKTEAYFGQVYPTIPRSATELIDFTEVI